MLQDTVDDVRNYIVEQKVQLESKRKYLTKSKVLSDRVISNLNQFLFYI